MTGLRALRRIPPGLTARRAWPHRDGLAVEVRDAAGGLLALVVTDDEIRVLPARDPALPALAPALAHGHATLIGHRPGRRAVLREADGHFLKVVRAGRAGRVADGLRRARALLEHRPGAPAVPRVRAADDRAGWVRLDPLPGPALHDLLRDDPSAAVALCGRLAPGLAALRAATPRGLPRHTAADEAELLLRWADDADGWTGTDLTASAAPVVDGLLALPPPAWSPCHRDLHDKQVLASGDRVGLLDLDTLCAADPALDVANLHAHLRLRTLQGRCSAATATACAAALADPAVDAAALAAYTAAALLRLAAVYAFRPGPPDLPARLAAEATPTPWSIR